MADMLRSIDHNFRPPFFYVFVTFHCQIWLCDDFDIQLASKIDLLPTSMGYERTLAGVSVDLMTVPIYSTYC